MEPGETSWTDTSYDRDYTEEQYWRDYCGMCDCSPCTCVPLVLRSTTYTYGVLGTPIEVLIIEQQGSFELPCIVKVVNHRNGDRRSDNTKTLNEAFDVAQHLANNMT